MLRRYAATLHLALGLADAASAALLFIVLSMIRFGSTWQEVWTSAGLSPIPAAVGYGIAWTAVLWLQGLYRLRARWSVRREVLDVAVAGLMLAVAVFTALFWLKLPDVSRLFLVALFPAQVALTVASRLAIRFVFARARARGLNTRYVLIVGANTAGFSFADRLTRNPDLGLRVIGYLVGPGETIRERPGRPILGRVEDVETILHSRPVDEVVICLAPDSWRFAETVARLCEEEGRIVRIPLSDVGLALPGGRVETFDGIEVLTLVYGPDRTLGLVAKTAVDLFGAAFMLLLLSPVYLVVASAILLRDGRPVFFRQTRVGLHGRPFRLLKFRTMVPDAEARLAEVEALNEIAGHAFKVTDDPRITRTGRVLRRLSIDELPQFWNVLRGEMSIVGPRPPLPREVERYDIWHRRRLSMKPGITGLWQVAARREGDFDTWVQLDLAYIDRWSFWLDVKIMARTIPAMLTGR